MCQPGRPLPISVSHARLVRLPLRLPEREVARVLLLVLVGVDALAPADEVAREVYLRELAVLGERADAVVVRAVGLVGVPRLFEPPDDVDHLGDVARRAGRHLGALGAERVEVFEEGVDVLCRVLVDGLAPLGRELDDAILDVRDVHHVRDLVAAVLEVAAQHVAEGGHRAEVADVRVVPDGRAAEVEFGLALFHGAELFEPAGEGVEEFEHLWFAKLNEERAG